MVSDNDFLDLQDRFNALKLTVDTLLQNLLTPALTLPGTLRFGANVMELGNQGIVIRNNTSVNAPSLFYVPDFSTNADGTTPYSLLTGYANVVAGNEDVASMLMRAAGESTISADSGVETFNVSTGVATAFWTATQGGTTATFTLGVSGGVGTLSAANTYFKLATTGAAPASPADGDFWYDSNKAYLRINGVTVELGAGGSSMPMPPLVGTDSWHCLGTQLAANAAVAPVSTTWQSANRALYIPLLVTEDITVTKLWVLNGATAAGNIDMGIYNSAFARQVSIGSTAQSGTNVIQEFDITDTPLTAGQYYIGIAKDDTAGTTFTYAAAGGGAKALQAWGMAQEATAFALPATATPADMASNVVPVCGIATRTQVA